MNEGGALEIWLDEREVTAPSVPEEVVRAVFEVEERVQFDQERREAAQKISRVVQVALDKEFPGGPKDGHAS